MMRRLGRIPRVSACSSVSLLSCIYHVLSNSLMRVALRAIAWATTPCA